MKKINLNAKIGDEIELVNGSSTLVIKVDVNRIIPDFVDALSIAVAAKPHDMIRAAQRVYHRDRGASELNRTVYAQIRDTVFESIKPEETRVETPIVVKEGKTQ